MFFFWLRPIFLWIKTLKESLLSVTSERRTSVPSDSVCVSVCLVQGVCGRESLVLGRVSMRFRTSPATPHRLGLCQRSVDFKHIFFFLSFSFVSHNLFRFWKKETFVIVWFLLEEKIYFFFRSVLVNWFLVSVVCNHNRIGFFLKMKLFFFFFFYLPFLFF